MYSVSNIPLLKSILSAIVGEIRPQGVIASISEVSGNSTIYSTNNLTVGDVVNMDNTAFVLLEVTEDSFVVEGTGITASEWYGLAPYFMHGHLEEIVHRLQERDQSQILRWQKYPLIILVEDVPQSITADLPNHVYSEMTFTLIICNLSQSTWDAPDRYTNNIEPILLPVYVDLMNAIAESDYFEIPLDENIPHNPIYRLAWGKEALYGNDGDMANDHVDAIEVADIVLKVKKNNICNN